ncbi:hypothetical protein [Micromonospora sp. ALFpr18c]|uniref:hypothetical protein n=1 Tax=unclassified Micromonospora TaxID=2617518 RepID=UPI001788B483|nr:hypothetical protein [Micromonospora sp. ALFpr18c]
MRGSVALATAAFALTLLGPGTSNVGAVASGEVGPSAYPCNVWNQDCWPIEL